MSNVRDLMLSEDHEDFDKVQAIVTTNAGNNPWCQVAVIAPSPPPWHPFKYSNMHLAVAQSLHRDGPEFLQILRNQRDYCLQASV